MCVCVLCVVWLFFVFSNQNGSVVVPNEESSDRQQSFDVKPEHWDLLVTLNTVKNYTFLALEVP